ncbi:protein disulfide oxidoreductase [Arcobacter sp. CECT 8983]|uniref:redoxin domain-containing protein n=1 Tax=Arcobacter sp. CECT 8983 TaxID=2044508 RepID=UPI00100BD577|nr:redoxin domain-containing protein [Arcobacter sp. CECT 8983]RXJ90648.1 protein disulfide oxidoreductase [Arcobacter sp. CECT 8983]
MKEKIKKYLKEIIVFVVVLTIAANVFSYYRSLDLNKEKLDLKTITLLDGSLYTLPNNKPVLLHFWATWCPTCKFEASNIEKISKDYEVITVAVQSGTKEDIQNYLNEHNLSFKVINDEDSFYSKKFNIKAFPSTFIYDSEKSLMFSEVGYTSTLGLYARMSLAK